MNCQRPHAGKLCQVYSREDLFKYIIKNFYMLCGTSTALYATQLLQIVILSLHLDMISYRGRQGHELSLTQ